LNAECGFSIDGLMLNVRKRIMDNPTINRLVEDAFADYVRFAYRTSHFERIGFEELDACVARNESVIMVLWHQRLIMAGYAFPVHLGLISSLTTAARAGRLAGQVLNRFGFDTVPLASNRRNIILSREILRRLKAGSSIGIAADGPKGPVRTATTVPLMWARVSQARVFAVSFSANWVLRLPTWDRLMLPLPWTRGVVMCREWTETVPHRLSDSDISRLRLSLEETLNVVTDEADNASCRRDRNVRSSA